MYFLNSPVMKEACYREARLSGKSQIFMSQVSKRLDRSVTQIARQFGINTTLPSLDDMETLLAFIVGLLDEVRGWACDVIGIMPEFDSNMRNKNNNPFYQKIVSFINITEKLENDMLR